MSEIIEIGIPMWGIGGDDELDQQAIIIADTRQKINQTDATLDELEEELNTLSSRANMYIKNAIKMNDYDNLKHILFIDDDLKASVYLLEEANKVDSLKDLPKPDEKDMIQLTSKQTNRIVELMSDYNYLIEDYEDHTESYEDLVSYHDEVWDNVITRLTGFSGLYVYDADSVEEIEQFDLEKHTLLVIRDENSQWAFRYIRNEDEDEFNRTIEVEDFNEEE